MLLGCGLLTANDALMKSLVSSLPPGQVIFLRAIAAFVVVLLLAPWVGGIGKLKAKRLRDVLLCSALLVFNIVVFSLCLPYLDFADAIILAYTSPIWVVALAPWLINERTGWQQWGAVLMGFAGAALVIKPGRGALHWAIFIPLVVAAVVGLRDIVSHQIASRESALPIVIHASALSIVVGLLLLPFGWKALDMLQLGQ